MYTTTPFKTAVRSLVAVATLLGLSLGALTPLGAQTLPVITTQPQSLNVLVGDPATFNVTATGGTLFYQWRSNALPISGARSSFYTISNAQPASAATYSVLVSNLVGFTISSNATLTVQQLDFGDAPDPFQTRLSANGARHIVVANFFLGARADVEPDGQPNSTATGDDINPATLDDEDGVTFTSPLVPGQDATIDVTTTMLSSETGRLDAWIDFNGNGSWTDSGEHIFASLPVHLGVNSLTFPVPFSARPGDTFARFRLTRQGFPRFDGLAPDGEVEDYKLTITAPKPCDETCTGTDFWLTFPGNYAPDPANPVQLSLCISGTPGTTGNVSAPGLGFSQNFVVPASQAIVVLLPKTADLGNANDQIQTNGVHVTASARVGVHGLNHVEHTSDGYVGLPTTVLGTEYIVQAFGNLHTGAPQLNGSQFAIVASESNTIVTITPSAVIGLHDQGIPYTITLQQGQTYQLRDTNDAPADLSGTILTSDKPIAVYGSHRCANVRSEDAFYCDYLVEQLLPLRNWGTNFVASLFATRAGDTFRCLASVDNTAVFVNGVALPLLNRGQSHELLRSTPTYITSDKPIFVTQYANSSDFDGVVDADPFMVVVPPTKLFNREHLVCTAHIDFPVNYLNVVVPSGVVGSVQLDGISIPAGSFTAIGGSGYSGAQLPVAVGPHSVVAPAPVGVTVYGWAEYDSYGWPGCLFFGDVTPPTISCLTSNVTVTLSGGTAGVCTTQVPDLRGQVRATDNCPGLAGGLTLLQQPPPGTTIGPGAYPVTITAIDDYGNAASCIITLTVIDPSPPSIFCSSNVVANCSSTSSSGLTPVFFQVTARSQCVTNLPVQCSPPSGSLFPLGITTVNCVATNSTGSSASCSFSVIVRCLKIAQPNPRTVVISWSGGGTLESAPSITGPWNSVTNARNPHVTGANQQEFFRIRYE